MKSLKCLSRYSLSCAIISGKHVLCMTWAGRRLLKCLAPSLIGSTLKSSHRSRLHARFLHHKNGIPSGIMSQQKTSVIYVNQGFFGSRLPVHLHRRTRDHMQDAVKSFVQEQLNNSDETRHTRLGTTVNSRWALVLLGSAKSTVLWSIGSPTSVAKCSVTDVERYQLMLPSLWDLLWIIKRCPSGCLQHALQISHPWPLSLFTFYFVKRPSSLMLVIALQK